MLLMMFPDRFWENVDSIIRNSQIFIINLELSSMLLQVGILAIQMVIFDQSLWIIARRASMISEFRRGLAVSGRGLSDIISLKLIGYSKDYLRKISKNWDVLARLNQTDF